MSSWNTPRPPKKKRKRKALVWGASLLFSSLHLRSPLLQRCAELIPRSHISSLFLFFESGKWVHLFPSGRCWQISPVKTLSVCMMTWTLHLSPRCSSPSIFPCTWAPTSPLNFILWCHLSATSFRQTSSSLTCTAGFPAQVLLRKPPHWFVFNEESFRLSDIISRLWVISGHLAELPTSLLGNWVIVTSWCARIL